MTVNAYEMLFADGNPNRAFVIQPYTRNGPATPTTGVDPSAVTANTTLFLYGKGTPDYGERIQEDMLYVLENFNNPIEPSFPVPGQIWSNTSVTPPQLYVYNAKKYTVVSNSGNVIALQSTGGLDSLAAILARFVSLGAKSFNVYSPTFMPFTFTQNITGGYPQISGGMVLINVTPVTPLSSMAGYVTGGWEDIWQGNTINILRQPLNVNQPSPTVTSSITITNLPKPTNPGDAANKAYVDAAISGGTLVLSDLGDVLFVTPFNPQTNSVLYFNGTKWTDKLITTLPFLPLSGGTMTGAINMGVQQINNVAMAAIPAAADAATVGYVASQVLPTQITTPNNLDLLVYNSGLFKWVNASATAAGVLPLSGGTMSGAINMNGYGISNLPALSTPYPVNPTDAATKAYVDSIIAGGGSGISGATYNSTSGVLTITQVSLPNTITVPGFLPVSATEVNYVPTDPVNLPVTTSGTFFQAALATYPNGTPNTFESPISIDANAAFNVLDQDLGVFTVPRQRLVMTGTGTKTAYNFATGVPNLPLAGGAPGVQYVVGSGSLSVYINGLKQIPSDRGFFKLTNVNTTTTIGGVTFSVGTGNLTIPGNLVTMLHAGANFSISGTSTANDGGYTVVSSVISGINTVVATIPNELAAVPGASLFVASGTGTFTYGPFGIMASMPTGYIFGGPSNVLNLSVSVNGNLADSLSIDTSTNNCTNFGLLARTVNLTTQAYYMNAIIGASLGAFGSFVVPGNRITQFTTGTQFTVRYSSSNNGTYLVNATPTYNPTLNQTTIVVTGTVPSNTVDGIIFQDNWGFSMKIENGSVVFYSNVAGTGSSVLPVSGTLLTNITGTIWPITVASFAGTTNPFTPQTWAYNEIGMVGNQSSLIEFTTAPQGPGPTPPADVIEIIVDRDMVFRPNPVSNAVTA